MQRKFGGKRYYFHGNTDHKRDAQNIAKELRKKGWLARVISVSPRRGWDIWKRRKKK